MKKIVSPLMNEEGSVMVYTIMVLTLLTVIGLAATYTSRTELEIAGADLTYQRNFYLAEGAAMEAADWLDNNPVTASSGPTWLELTPGSLNAGTMADYWAGSEAALPQTSSIDAAASFLACYEGVSAGSSLDVSKSKMHEISIYGRSEKRGVVEIRLGYLMAF
jgi:Tfp pilus assembly protein PilX